MEVVCVPGPAYNFLAFVALGSLWLLLVVCIVWAITSSNAPSKSDGYAAQIHAQGRETRASVQQLTEAHIREMARAPEELRRKRKTG